MSLLTGKTDPVSSIPVFNAASSDWIEWYKVLDDNFGKNSANELWLKAWGIRGSTKISDNTLRAFMKKEAKIEIPATWGQKIDDAGVSAVDSALGIFQMGHTAAIAVMVIVLGGAAMLIFNIARKPESIGAIAKAAAV